MVYLDATEWAAVLVGLGVLGVLGGPASWPAFALVALVTLGYWAYDKLTGAA